MPLSKYNRYFGGKASKAYKEMCRRYGHKKGKEVFYASVNSKKKKKGR